MRGAPIVYCVFTVHIFWFFDCFPAVHTVDICSRLSAHWHRFSLLSIQFPHVRIILATNRINFCHCPFSLHILHDPVLTGQLRFVSSHRTHKIVSSDCANKSMKSGESLRDKHYRALCWCPLGGLTTELIIRLHQKCSALTDVPQPTNGAALVWPPERCANQSSVDTPYPRIQFGPIVTCQPTPIRVLHRRALLDRCRTIKSIELASFEAALAKPDMDVSLIRLLISRWRRFLLEWIFCWFPWI